MADTEVREKYKRKGKQITVHHVIVVVEYQGTCGSLSLVFDRTVQTRPEFADPAHQTNRSTLLRDMSQVFGVG